MSESGRMIYRVNTEYAQIELFHEAGDTEPYEIIELDEAVHIYQSLVRCKECKFWIGHISDDDGFDEEFDECRWRDSEAPDADDFCSYGEREGE